VIVKPAAEDASLGLGADSVVGDRDGLARQVERIRSYGPVLVEQFVPGREFNAGFMALPDPRLLPLAEIEFQEDPALPWPIVTYDAKWTADSADNLATPVRCPADVEASLADRIRDVALAACRVTGCRDYARVDLRVSAAGEVFILEINANPDLSPTAGLARAVRAGGWDYGEFLVRLAEQAALRRSH
jgi:D-alanine-D-alanine ligase